MACFSIIEATTMNIRLNATLAVLGLGLGSVASAQTVISGGHVDLFEVEWENSELHLGLHAEDYAPGHFEPGDAIVELDPEALTSRPAGAQFDFIGVAAGAPIFRVWEDPFANPVNTPWFGIAAEDIPTGTLKSYVESDARVSGFGSRPWVTVSLVSFSGPGEFSIWRDNGTVWMATADGVDASDKFIFPSGGHVHQNWAFTASGVYQLGVKASAYLADGTFVESHTETYTVNVVPEPASMVALGLGAVALIRRRRK